jgi:hypothetical protein
VDHDFITGDDRGGIALSTTNVFYTGDIGTGRFSAADLSGGTLPQTYDALVSNLRTETVLAGQRHQPFGWRRHGHGPPRIEQCDWRADDQSHRSFASPRPALWFRHLRRL